MSHWKRRVLALWQCRPLRLVIYLQQTNGERATGAPPPSIIVERSAGLRKLGVCKTRLPDSQVFPMVNVVWKQAGVGSLIVSKGFICPSAELLEQDLRRGKFRYLLRGRWQMAGAVGL